MATRIVPSTCWECGTLCGALLTLDDAGHVTKVAPNPTHPTSRGAFCVKGIRGLPEWTDHPDRLLHPLRPRGGPHRTRLRRANRRRPRKPERRNREHNNGDG